METNTRLSTLQPRSKRRGREGDGEESVEEQEGRGKKGQKAGGEDFKEVGSKKQT